MIHVQKVLTPDLSLLFHQYQEVQQPQPTASKWSNSLTDSELIAQIFGSSTDESDSEDDTTQRCGSEFVQPSDPIGSSGDSEDGPTPSKLGGESSGVNHCSFLEEAHLKCLLPKASFGLWILSLPASVITPSDVDTCLWKRVVLRLCA